MPRITNIQQRGGTAAQWNSANPVLAAREVGLETDTMKMKVGNGSAAWAGLPYFADTDMDVSNLWKSPYFLPSTNGANGLGTLYAGAEVIPAGNAAQLAVRDHIGLDKYPIMAGDKFVIEYTGKSILGGTLFPNVGVWMYTAAGAQGVLATHGWNAYDSASGGATVIATLANGFSRYRRVHTIPNTAGMAASATPPRLGSLYFQMPQTSPYTDAWIISDVTMRRVVLDAEIDTVSGSKVTGLTKSSVGLGSVDNTADTAKPVSTAQQTALNGKENTIAAGTTAQYWRGDKSWQTLNAAAVGLGSVNNTSDAAKPISTATQTALDAKSAVGHSHAVIDGGTPSSVPTKIETRNGTAAQWTAANPVLNAGEMGIESDTLKVKFGNGTAAWTALPYGLAGGTGLQTTDQTGAWDTWRKALASMGTKTAKMLHLGDSITEGTGVTTRQETWPFLVAQKIRQAYPSIPGNAVVNSTGWSPIRQTSTTLPSTWTISGTYTDNLFGFRFTRTIALQPGGTVTGTVTGTSIDIWYPKGTATGNFTVKVDGVQVGGTYGGTAASTTDGFVQRVSLGAAGTHTVVLTSTHASNPQYFSGVTVYNGNENSGVVSINAGFHGSNTANWLAAASNANWVQNLPALDPDLVTIALGANDYTGQTGFTTYKENLRYLVEQIRANCVGYPSICFISVGKRSEDVTPSWGVYEFGLQQLATEMGCGFIDMRRVLPDAGSAEAVSAGLYVDSVHPSAAGYAIMANEISRVLLDPTTGVLMVPPDPAPVGHTHAVASSTSDGFMSAADKTKLDNTASGLVASTIVTRDANSNFSAGMPSAAAHVATKAYVDGALGGATNGGVIIGTDGRLYRAIACVVRNTGSGFEFISDAGHAPVGVSSISTAADQLTFTINYSFTASKVSSLVGTPDETLARLGYTMGATVGLTSATFSVSQPGGFGDYLSWNGSAWTSYNGFITSASMNGTTGLVTANHDDVNGTILGAQVSSRSFTYRATTDSMSGTTSSFYLVNNSGVSLKTPNTTDCKVWISRDGARRVKMSELTYANSNIWIFGMMEI